ncbi:Acg family FMN-binding oxidoreductase [Pelosinus propionicus]|uniref:Tat (Twin-arginine translocation) pathway signal sequence n=1 Tax=Pelosinus propionicus DSM 13327 TaxID=1123291 RepID=A0A1I4ICA8_9FIRM|nr:nitroreductase [Pelosinus propionicus]SFL52012.1 hypothetical protein SAMN04490355_1007135 [Pelosinus propionicus DSM 13327]
MNRRQFIKWSGAGLAAAGGLSLFHSLAQLKEVARDNSYDYVQEIEKDFRELLYLASLAPSGHNTQPWTVKFITVHHWIIGTDAARWLPAVDPENREVLISIGAFLENLVVAARAKGYDIEVQIKAQSSRDKEIVDLQLHKVAQSESFDIKKIQLRRTIRNNFLTNELSNEDIRFLAGKNKESFFYFSRQAKEGKYLSQGTVLANKIQADRNSTQEELAKWIRWSNEEGKKYQNGLTAETMEIEGIARWFVKNFYSRQSALANHFRKATIQKIQEQVATGSGWLLLTSKDSSITELINIGRNLQRIWLAARDKKIAIHPMTQMVEEIAVRNDFFSRLGIAGEMQLLLRVGYINDYPKPVSLRMPLQRIIV